MAANIPLNDGTGSRSARSLEIGTGIHHQMFAGAAQLRLPVGSTLTRPANTTAYAVGDAISNNATAGSVTAVGSVRVALVLDCSSYLRQLLLHIFLSASSSLLRASERIQDWAEHQVHLARVD